MELSLHGGSLLAGFRPGLVSTRSSRAARSRALKFSTAIATSQSHELFRFVYSGRASLLQRNDLNGLNLLPNEGGRLRREIERRGPFHELMAHYGQALFGFVAQSTACNAVHSVEQRLARWLLMARDRMGSDEFPLTQEFAAMMLGASRPTVTVVAGTLQKAGLIKYRHGHVTVVDRHNLEAASCECYRAATNLLNAVTDGSRSR